MSRFKGEGTIFRRRDGRWCARIDLGWVNGRRKQKFFYAHNRAAAADLLVEALHKRKQGETIPTNRTTLGRFMQGWLETVKATRRPRTHQQYEMLNRLHVEPALGQMQLTRLDAQAVQALLDAKVKQGLSPGTVRHVRTLLRRALNVALKRKLVSLNVAALADELPPRRKPEIKPLTEEQVRSLLVAAREHYPRWEALFALAVRLGLRRGELAALRWDDVNLERRELRVAQSLQRVPGQPLTSAEPKTQGARRVIVMPKEIIKLLRVHRARQAQERLVAGSEWNDSGLIFANTIGKPQEPRRINTVFDNLKKKAGLPASTRVHDLRHTAGVRLLEHKVALYDVSQLLGHSSIAITADVYAHWTPKMQRDLADRIDTIANAELHP
ncbi:MAG: site-specific integrase [Candidatus Binatus sp.]